MENLQKIESGAWKLCDIVVGDKSWFYHRRIKSKQELKVWLAKGKNPPTDVRRQQFEEKTMFIIFL
jgi:hypothetical protein